MSLIGDAILQKAEESFSNKREGEMFQVLVPEWGEPAKEAKDDLPAMPAVPAILYFKPSTLAERDVIYRAVEAGGLGSLIQIILVRARDEDGNTLFKKSSRLSFERKIDPDIINRIVKDLAVAEGLEIEDMSEPDGKNL